MKHHEFIKDLSIEEKIELAQELWDQVCEHPFSHELTHEQKEILERRSQELEENPSILLSWEEVKQRIETRLCK